MKKKIEKIGGDNIIVECEKSLFGRRKYNRKRQRKNTWIVGFVERTAKKK